MKLAVAKLASSGLTPGDIEALGMQVLTGPETAGIHSSFRSAASLKINYYHPVTGAPLTARPGWDPFFRLRYLEDAGESNGKPLRYTQLPEAGCCAYFPTTINWKEVFDDLDQSIIITEGELKAAKTCDVGLPCIGLGGVWNFLSTKAWVGFLKELELVPWVKRRVYIIYDSDAVTKPNVIEALNKLAQELELRGAIPFTVLLPDVLDGGKTGLDDYLVHRSLEELVRLIQHSRQCLTLAQPLWDLNNEVAVVREPHAILEMKTGSLISPGAFKDSLYANRRVPEMLLKDDGSLSLKQQPLAATWLKWPFRREVGTLVYEPGQPRITEGNDWNMWERWGVLPAKGNMNPFFELVKHLFSTVGPEDMRWFLQWCAYPIQYPGTKLYTCVAIHGRKQGTGKSLLFYTLGKIYGPNFTEIKKEHLQGQFNSWSKYKQLILADDVTGHDKRDLADKLKALVTQKENRINTKYVPDYTMKDCVNWAFTSNAPDAFFLEDDDRRFFVHEVTVDPLPDKFFEIYDEWLWKSDKGAAAVHHYLKNLSLEGFNPRARALETSSKLRMIALGRSDLDEWVEKLKLDPESVLRVQKQKLARDLYTARELLALYDPTGSHKVTSNGMARALRRAGFHQALEGSPIRTDHGTDRYFVVRNFNTWRKATMSAMRHHLKQA